MGFVQYEAKSPGPNQVAASVSLMVIHLVEHSGMLAGAATFWPKTSEEEANKTAAMIDCESIFKSWVVCVIKGCLGFDESMYMVMQK